ncbi:hypothetical protein BUALT_Bualt06G0022900 [Buddleja alternifolia]|uniref:BTB/POZ domain-containing protein n=1 Tax=Buddleja alternifolia TaxID=168488 RepID=A0AAV6XDG7_9LAMI|nr:hypothetical protein BUALT_Bualt06G0022900 [Buddleja alternifolia]
MCATGLPSDVCIVVGETSFHLHKFPLLSRSGLLEKLIQRNSVTLKGDEETKCVLSLHDLPGGSKSFLLIAKFCYGVKIEITATDVAGLRCAAEYLQMNENYGEGNLISQTETFLNVVLKNWVDTVKALETCQTAIPLAEELHIISRCINSLATNVCSELTVHGPTHSPGHDWWYDDVAILELPIFKRLILAVGSKGMAPERIAGSLMYYAKRYLPLNGRQSRISQRNLVSAFPVISDDNQRALIEEIIELLPNQKGVTPTKFLIRLLRTAMILHASPSCRENLEGRIGAQLDQAVLEDILIPNTSYLVETLYDVECVQRIVDHFMLVDREDDDFTVEGQLVGGSDSLSPMTMVANLLDNYLAEVASDVNLKLEKFVSLAAAFPDYARPIDDGIYRAIDIYLKAHPGLMDSEREHLCRLMNCQKLSLEATSHAAQNESLPLRVIVQVLFFEQLRLRTSIAGWFFVSDNLENSQHLGQGNDRTIPMSSGEGQIVTFDDMRGRVSKLEKECENMKQEIEKIVKSKGSWNSFYKRFGLKFKAKSGKLLCNGEALRPSIEAVLSRK